MSFNWKFLIISAFLMCLMSINAKEKEKFSKKNVGTVIGIDLGTTYSCVGVFINGRIEIIANDQGNRITPSYVAFTTEGERLIGDTAKSQLTSNPENTIFDIKRLIGREWTDPSVQNDIKNFPFKVLEKNNKPHIEVETGFGRRIFAPEEISAMILTKMKETAEAYLGVKVTHAVITVPAYFNDAQRQATKNAAAIAGLKIMRIINEPTAATIAYDIYNGISKEEKNVLVYDLGGGTFDVSLLTIEDGVFEVVATNGNTNLGGEDFNQRVIDYLINLYKKKTGNKVRDINKIQKLRREVEKAKRTLSRENSTTIVIDYFFDGEDFRETLTRDKFEELNEDLFSLTLKSIEKVLDDADFQKEDIDEIILVGGSTRIPKVQQLVETFFDGKEPILVTDLNNESVVFGAAVEASNTGELALLDVNPFTLGIETVSGLMSKIIPRNSVIPNIKSLILSTSVDNQEIVSIPVFEGNSNKIKDNYRLGQITLTRIPPAPRGVPQIHVTIEIDVNGIIKVSAEHKETGNKEIITINNGLTPNDIERMIKDAEKFADYYKKVKERVDAKNELERYTYSMRRQLSDNNSLGGIITDADKTIIENAVNKTIKWLESNSDAYVFEIKYKKKKLEDTVQSIVENLDGVGIHHTARNGSESYFKEEL